nr:retrovirus-related Pol polyprotein from transposon TNT 1-94 [Tanacetum cinerariifolium]
MILMQSWFNATLDLTVVLTTSLLLNGSVETPYELLKDDQKKQLDKKNESKMTLYNALPRKEYEQVFMCKTKKEQVSCEKVSACSSIKMESKVDGYEEAKDLAIVPLDVLIGNLKLQDEALNFSKFKKSSVILDDMLSRQKLSQDKEGLGFSKIEKTNYVSLRKPIMFVKEGQNGTPIETAPNAPGDEPSRHQRARRLVKNEIPSNDLVKLICPQTRFANNRGPLTSQSNEIVERTHHKLRKTSRAMLDEQSIPQKFLCHALDMETYIFNRVYIRKFINKTPYEILRNRKPSVEYIRVFGCKVFIVSTKVNLTKFDPKSYEGMFLGYSQTSKAYIILNKEKMRIEEYLKVTFDESLLKPKSSPSIENDRINEPIVQDPIRFPSLEANALKPGYPKSLKEARGHLIEQVIVELNERTFRYKTKQA